MRSFATNFPTRIALPARPDPTANLPLGRPDKAAEVFQEVLDRTSGNRMVYRLLVDALIRSGQTERAEETLRESLELDPLFTRARIILSEILG